MNSLCLPLLALIVILGITLYYRYSVRYFKIWKQLQVAGPRPWPLFGTTLHLLRKGVAKHDCELIQKYGRVVGTFEGRFPVLLIADEETIKSVLVKNFANFTDRRSSDLDPFPVNKTLAKLRGQRWKAVRSILTPAFSTAKLKHMTPIVNRCASNLVENLRQHSTNVIFKDCCGAFAVDVIARVLLDLDLDLNSQGHRDDDDFVHHAKRIFNHRPTNATAILLFAMPFLMPLFQFIGIRPSFLPMDSLKFFVEKISRVVDLRLSDPQSQSSDFLQLLIDSSDFTSHTADNTKSTEEIDRSSEKLKPIGLSREEVIAQAFMFLIAGYETTATAATLFAYNLATHPDCQMKLHEEIDQNNSPQGEVTDDDLSKLPYLQMCIEESLRLYPPAFRVDRFCSRETTVGCLRIPQGCIVTIPVYSVNRDPDYWPQPDKFIPERFSSSEKHRRSPCINLPFGLGPRSCIGRRLAFIELKVLFVHILRLFSIHLSNDSPSAQELEFEKGVLLQLKRPLLLTLKPRTGHNS